MHDTAFEIGAKFIATYAGEGATVLEIGSCDVNGSLRSACASSINYLGVDFEHGKGVDILTSPGEKVPIRSQFCDLLISSSQLEHDPMFWQTFLEFCRLTKEGGFIYISAPSNGIYHRYPSDIWRFYPDAGIALRDWALLNGHKIVLLESFTARRKNDLWNDFVAIFHIGEWPDDRDMPFLSDSFDCYNVIKYGHDEIINRQLFTEDQLMIAERDKEIARLTKQVESYEARLAELSAGPPPEESAETPAGGSDA